MVMRLASFSESTSDSDEIRSTKLIFTSSPSIIRCFLCSGEHVRSPHTSSVAEEVMTAAFEEGSSLIGEATWLTSPGAGSCCPLDPNDGASARSLKGISLTTTISSSSLSLFTAAAAAEEPTGGGGGSSSDEDEISDAGDAERDERIGDEAAELLRLSPLFSPSADLLSSLFLE